jgi:hypothetical protein
MKAAPRSQPKKPIPLPCSARPTASRKTGTDPILLSWEKWGLSLFFLLAGCAPLAPLPPESTAFGILGDTPYSDGEVERLDRMIDDINTQRLGFVLHVGDIGASAQACGDDWVLKRKAQFARIRHPFILLPGDNEWSDCHRRGDPLERLASWRRLFCFPEKSFPDTKISLQRQAGEYCEHIRWEYEGALFVALNVPGSNNNFGHSTAMDAEHERRMSAVFEWLDESIALAESRGASRVVVVMQANPFVPRFRDGFARLRSVLETHAAWLKGRLVLVHGDTHLYRDDEPLPGLRRLEVWGSPFVSWLRATLAGGELRVENAGQY